VPTVSWCREVRAVLFDLDGVLVDSGKSVERAWRAWASTHQIEWSFVSLRTRGLMATAAIRELLPHLDSRAVEREARELMQGQVHDTVDVRAHPGTRQMLDRLPRSRWAVVSASSRQLVYARLAACGHPFPSVIVGAEDVLLGKPDPEGYRLAASALGVECQRCLVVEDSPVGVAAGKAAGMTVVGVETTHHRGDLAEAEVTVPDTTCLTIRAEQGRLLVRVRQATPLRR
jgi:mannitol-1-/sugar-/sorbitol-6-phosphatase